MKRAFGANFTVGGQGYFRAFPVRERREITALFTDIEGFSAMTRRADPTALMTTLDSYFEGMATIVVAHGGTIDKIVGDAVHAFFNAANDLDDHPRNAIACAIAQVSWSETFRCRPEAATIGFGRTRIGIETGPAIVGDIGVRTTLDYTAHGDAVNVAARLEHANKQLGSSICIGPVAASCCDQSLLRPLGKITFDGRDDLMAVFEPCCGDVCKGSSATLNAEHILQESVTLESAVAMRPGIEASFVRCATSLEALGH